jgi:hypothetical protein
LPNYVSITQGIVVPSNASTTLGNTSTNERKVLVAMEPLKFEKPLELEKVFPSGAFESGETIGPSISTQDFLLTFNLVVEESLGVQMEKLQSLLEL